MIFCNFRVFSSILRNIIPVKYFIQLFAKINSCEFFLIDTICVNLLLIRLYTKYSIFFVKDVLKTRTFSRFPSDRKTIFSQIY